MNALEDLLQDWLPHQRWYGGKGVAVTAVRVATPGPPARRRPTCA